MTDPVGNGWRWRLLVAEAALRLALAHLLVNHVPMARWRRSLGRVEGLQRNAERGLEQAQRLARAVMRAANRVPFATKCLPRAMALHAMMRRRGLGGQLVIGVLDATRRGALEDLHAWVEVRGEILIGAIDEPFHPIIRFG
jgi:hypothetical protein